MPKQCAAFVLFGKLIAAGEKGMPCFLDYANSRNCQICQDYFYRFWDLSKKTLAIVTRGFQRMNEQIREFVADGLHIMFDSCISMGTYYGEGDLKVAAYAAWHV